MCEICDGITYEELRLRLHNSVQTIGWGIQYVEKGRLDRCWAYTIGLSGGFDHPELAVFGLRPRQAAKLLNAMGEDIAAGDGYRVDDEVLWKPPLRFRLVPVDPSRFDDHWFAVWVDYYRGMGLTEPKRRALELVRPGKRPALMKPAQPRPHLPKSTRKP